MSRLTEEMELFLEFDNPKLLKKIREPGRFLVLNKGERFRGEFDFNGENYFIAVRAVLSRCFELRVVHWRHKELRLLRYDIKQPKEVRERILDTMVAEERDLALFKVPLLWQR